jgi:hypothetical protein
MMKRIILSGIKINQKNCNRWIQKLLQLNSIGEENSIGLWYWGRGEMRWWSDNLGSSPIKSHSARSFLTFDGPFWYTTAKLDPNIFR